MQKSADMIASDMHAWVRNRSRFAPVPLPPLVTGKVQVEVSDVPEFSAQLILGDLLLASGELERAEKLYRELARARRSQPTSPPHSARLRSAEAITTRAPALEARD